ncbi:hypothetical protein [Bythopirellula polymerisocia]|uniref:Uncharacterized protein n=1 Tax=Bythopirellula polymerisocia TaxID=2528003 RepID=A0A5C6D4W8_9BACT|nr:hypothetical protein [Bythopirellula polymerisocia]TWU29919.1 hypothetical protein Pla144_07000 [Bythopirellula polymerisocia]
MHAAFSLLVTMSIAIQAISLKAEESATYLLKSEIPADSTAEVTVKLEVGGDMLVTGETEVKELPLKVLGHFTYREKIVAWTGDPLQPARSVRQYDRAEAHIEVDDRSSDRKLPDELLLAEIRGGEITLAGTANVLTREQYDLVNIVANSLAIDRLLPGKEMAEGESWEHDKETMQTLLAMDHLAVCDVSSVATKLTNREVQIRMAGTVDGTVDGAPTEMELRGAYLFHLDKKRITGFNLAIKESRKTTEIVPGLDVVAKVFVTVNPRAKSFSVPKDLAAIASRTDRPLERKLVYQSPTSGFSFEYDPAWYVTAEERDLFSFRYLHDHQLAAHCNVNVLPPRSEGRQTKLDEFERDVREALGDKLETVSASTEWETPLGYHCLGVIANGTVKDVPIEWRHYLVAANDCPRLSLGVTLEQSQGAKFADAERQMIDSLKLEPTDKSTATETATKAGTKSR